ncbi:uncharacterized protein EAE97_010139 [Botrytis byssoidea]|uniref:Uncharacterized protein n=1 Tax=Botrytis byssoidea TaxID=139641 RepID=A0A9P5HYD2_9HELO|nr:uncharacterized protein EAE97_010139 [Botrytis byssoidea]KAF7926630.1 hypothetical protein EAE97_010139 [Botrytis byssoidea]
MSFANAPVSNSLIMTAFSPISSGLKHEVLESPFNPGDGSKGLNTKISASDQNTGAKVKNLSPEFCPQSEKQIVSGVRVRDFQRIKELDDFIASALAQFPVDEFIKRFTVAKGKLQQFYKYKTQIDADQGKEINDNIEIMKVEILQSKKVLSILMEQTCAFKQLNKDFPECKVEESVIFEKQYVVDQLQKAKMKLEALEMMCVRLHNMIDQCSRILGGRWDKY